MSKDEEHDEQRQGLLSIGSTNAAQAIHSNGSQYSRENKDSIASSAASYGSLYDSVKGVAFCDDAQTINETVASETDNKQETRSSVWHISCILSSAFSYGCIMTTLFLITLPLECARLHMDHKFIPKSVVLGIFVAIAGATQLISPLVGRLSDTFVPPSYYELGQRIPYLALGSVLTCLGLLGETLASRSHAWLTYGVAFVWHMIGINIVYAMMVTLIPDQVPSSQTGVANGILAFAIVTGSLFGFGLFHTFLDQSIQSMYVLYILVMVLSTILTLTYAHDKDASITGERMLKRQQAEKRLSQRDSLAYSTASVDMGGPSNYSEQSPDKNAITILALALILKSMFIDPITATKGNFWKTLLKESYSIDPVKHFDFCMVTWSRLFYYCGMSVQTFFLYFIHDIVQIRHHPETVVATMAIIGQCSAALTCLPVGILSDPHHRSDEKQSCLRACATRSRKPWVYGACAVLGTATVCLSYVRTLPTMMIISLVLGAANGVYLTMDTSLAVDTLPKSSHKNKQTGEHEEDSTAQLLGIWGVAAFVGSALGPMIGGPLLYVFGRKGSLLAFPPSLDGSGSPASMSSPDDDDMSSEEYSIRGYIVLLSMSCLYFFLSAFALRNVKTRSERGILS
jgi:MFS family permease